MTFAQFWRSERRNLIKLDITHPIILSQIKMSMNIAWIRGGSEALTEQMEKIGGQAD